MTVCDVDILIVGGGVAGAACALELRTRGFAGSITLATRELDPPYHRPPITKGHLTGAVSADAMRVVEDEWWAAHDVELLTRTSVTAIDPATRTATLGKEDQLRFGQALLAPGARIRRLAVDGGTLPGIHYLRVPGNGDRLREAVASAGPVAIVGGSYIACEVAASLVSSTDVRVTMVMLEFEPLEHTLGPDLGRVVGDELRRRGVDLAGGQTVARFEPRHDDDSRVGVVVTESNLRVLTDEVVVGVGALPETSLAKSAGLAIGPNGGFRCDATLRTANPTIFVAGDACDFDSPLHGEQVRIEHEDVATAQGAHVARNMLAAIAGEPLAPYAVVPHFWSELGDWLAIDSVGLGGPAEAGEPEGDPDALALSVRFTRAGRLVGFASLNGAGDLDAASAEIAAAALGKR